MTVENISEIISVHCAAGNYPVIVGDNLLSSPNRWKNALANSNAELPKRVALISSEAIFPLHGDSVIRALGELGIAPKVILLPDGESHKNWESVKAICDAFATAEISRSGVAIALGGGVVGDVAGFAAAIYMRGIAFVQAPTTLLAQADAAIGGKTAINHARGKNLIGAFHQPKAVLCDSAALATLPAREFRAGLAEVVKYGLICDAEFFSDLEKIADRLAQKNGDAIRFAVINSVKIKGAIVSEDERESGRRALLNLGHTFAHAIENAAGYGEWLHGEAVAAGLVAAAKLSEAAADFPLAETARIIALLHRLELPTAFPNLMEKDLMSAMRLDKKSLDGNARFVLMKKIGASFLADGIAPELIRDAMEKCR